MRIEKGGDNQTLDVTMVKAPQQNQEISLCNGYMTAENEDNGTTRTPTTTRKANITQTMTTTKRAAKGKITRTTRKITSTTIA